MQYELNANNSLNTDQLGVLSLGNELTVGNCMISGVSCSTRHSVLIVAVANLMHCIESRNLTR